MENNDNKKIHNLMIEIKEGHSISCSGPVTITLIEAARNNNIKRSLLSIQATRDVKIKKNDISKNA